MYIAHLVKTQYHCTMNNYKKCFFESHRLIHDFNRDHALKICYDRAMRLGPASESSALTRALTSRTVSGIVARGYSWRF